jgi:hypothetical protein
VVVRAVQAAQKPAPASEGGAEKYGVFRLSYDTTNVSFWARRGAS